MGFIIIMIWFPLILFLSFRKRDKAAMLKKTEDLRITIAMQENGLKEWKERGGENE